MFVPAVAKSAHADHGPLRLVAVQYMLSFGAVSPRQLILDTGKWRGLTPSTQMACKHAVSTASLVQSWRFIILCVEVCR